MSRLQSVVLTVAALAISGYSLVPPWVAVDAIDGRGGDILEAPRLVVTHPLGSFPLWDPPRTDRGRTYGRVDYGRLVLYYLSTMALLIPFFVWRRRGVRSP